MKRSRPYARAFAAFGAAWLAVGSAHADAETSEPRPDGSAPSSEPADEVVVRGSAAAGFSSQTKLGDATRETTDAAGLLEPLPGVHVRRLGGDDSFATLSIRGSTSSQVAIVLAGVPLTGGADPTLDLATLPLWPGARARVYRSFAPASLGTGSLGGTLALDPPRAGGVDRTEVWAAAGAFGARRLRAGDVRALGDSGARVATALSASRSDDDFSFYDATHDAFTTRENSGHAAVNGLASVLLPVRYADASEGALTVTMLAQARRQRLPGAMSAPTPFAELASNRELAALELSRPTASGAWSVRAWGRREGLRVRDKAPTATLGPTHTDDAIVAAGSSLGWRGGIARDVSLEARVDGSGERFAPGETIGAAQPSGATRASGGAGADVEWAASRAVTLGGAGRVDAWSDRADDGTSGGAVRPTGHAGGEVAIGPARFAAHAGAVARPPSFVERYGNRGGIIGDPQLRSESAWTVDVGARVASRAPRFGVRAEVAGFGTWSSDLIVFVPEGAGLALHATNIGRARLFGVEAEVVVRVALGGEEAPRGSAALELRTAYTGLATFNDAECGVRTACDPPPLPGRPAHDFVNDAAVTFGPLRIRYGLDALSGMRADLVGNIVVPARVLQSAGARLDVPGVRGLRVALDVRNLFDVRYATYDGVLGPVREPIGDLYDYPLPGRSALLSVRWTSEPREDPR